MRGYALLLIVAGYMFAIDGSALSDSSLWLMLEGRGMPTRVHEAQKMSPIYDSRFEGKKADLVPALRAGWAPTETSPEPWLIRYQPER